MAAGSAAVRVVGEEGLELGGDDGRVPKGLLRAIRRCSQGHWGGGGDSKAERGLLVQPGSQSPLPDLG